MKKTIFCIAIFAFYSFCAMAQKSPIPNPGFEDWKTDIYYKDINQWFTSNLNYFVNLDDDIPPTIVKSQGSQGSCAVLQNVFDKYQDLLPGYLSYGLIYSGENSSFDFYNLNGLPFSGIPDSISFKAKMELANSDSALIVVAFSKNGKIIDTNVFRLNDSNSPTFKRYSFKLNPRVLAGDTLFLGFYSSDITNTKNIKLGRFFLDELSFIGNENYFIPNSDFEVWKDISEEHPKDWFSTNYLSNYFPEYKINCTKSLDRKSGNFALRLESNFVNGRNLGYINRATYYEELENRDGISINFKPNFCSFDAKYLPMYKEATAGVFIEFSKIDSVTLESNEVGYFGIPITETGQDSFKHFRFNFNLTDTPDLVQIGISSDVPQEIEQLSGSVLLFDNLVLDDSLKDSPFGIKTLVEPSSLSIYYKGNDVIKIQSKEAGVKNFRLKIFDVQGKMFYNQLFESLILDSNGTEILLPKLSNGTYIYQIVEKKGVSKGKIAVY